ncbi:MAG: helix-turn-helix domain-containing protein [Acidimicrobiia bacterium]|nr:helix-turn-helix domain-containing protein [Acidimicrobiia bacterium]
MAARLSFDERCMISAMIEVDASTEKIANQLGRCPSTIRRELKQVGGRTVTGLTTQKNRVIGEGCATYSHQS